MFHQSRLNKSRLGEIVNDGHDSSEAIGFQVYVLEDQVEEFKEKVVAKVRECTEMRQKELERLVRISKGSPSELFIDDTID